MKEVTGPIIATSLVLVAVFGPTMLLPGITGRMFGQFGTTLVIAVMISTINAMTLSPALAATFLRHRAGQPNIVIRGFNAVFDRVRNGYTSLVEWLTSHLLVGMAIIAALFVSLVFLFRLVPTSFIPDEDKGYFIVDVQLPPAASLSRTVAAMDGITERLLEDANMENVLSVNGYSILNAALQSNAGMVIAKLKPWSERAGPGQDQLTLQRRYQQEFAGYPDLQAIVFSAPAIPGLGTVAGFSFVLEDTVGRNPDEFAEVVDGLIGTAMQQPEIMRAFSSFRAGSPQINLEIDRIRAKSLGVSLSDLFVVLQTQLGGYYVNDFNLFGRSFKVMVQADAEFRQDEGDLNRLYVQSVTGDQVPLSAIVTATPSRGPDILYRYNMYDSATITGIPNVPAGYSSGAAMTAMEATAGANLPDGFRYDWTASSYEERKSGNAAPLALGLSLVFTFLFLAALYESFLTPLAIILAVPLAVIGALIALLVGGEPLSLYGQIGLVMLVGLSAKTAILIVEYSKALRERDGLELGEAATKAARLRFRAVLMTSLSFVAGVFPLVIASGAGAASRVSLGLAVFGGTIMASIIGTIFVPVFFRAVQGFRERVHGGKTSFPDHAA
jgi:HAE1 family hydrophobic/amphiphilic exporter-1